MFFNDEKVYSVKEITKEIRNLIEGNFFFIAVSGEIAEFKVRSNHAYFLLKEKDNVLKSVFFNLDKKKLKFVPDIGQQVICKGRLSVYSARGEYQLIVETMELVGAGDEIAKFEEIKRKLESEGLFNDEFKKELPVFPYSIGVITSQEGAAIKDIEKIISQGAIKYCIYEYPAVVQGKNSSNSLINGIKYFNSRSDIDLIIIGRGGGSSDDLMPFNDEKLGRIVFSSKIPVISAVGHQSDYSITDFVADVRAATPTEAAQLVVDRQNEYSDKLKYNLEFISEYSENKSSGYLSDFLLKIERLSVFKNSILMKLQYVDNLEQMLKINMINFVENQKNSFDFLVHRLFDNNLINVIDGISENLFYNLEQLQSNSVRRIENITDDFLKISMKLDYLSPLKIIERGYGIVTKSDKVPIGDVKLITKGDEINVKLNNGDINCEVKTVNFTDTVSNKQ